MKIEKTYIKVMKPVMDYVSVVHHFAEKRENKSF